MSAAELVTGTRLALGPDIRRGALPFGVGVLVNAVTLAVAEFGEPDLAAVDRLLALGVPPPEAGLAVWRMAAELVEGGWFVTDNGEGDAAT